MQRYREIEIVSNFFDFLHSLEVKAIGMWGQEEDIQYLDKINLDRLKPTECVAKPQGVKLSP